MGVLKDQADRYNITMLLVHHLHKQGVAAPFQQISGANVLLGAADTIWLLQRQRMSTSTRMLVTGRDMDTRTLHLQSVGCVWQLTAEQSAEQMAQRTVPACVGAVAEFVQRQKCWQSTATELLIATGISDVQPNQLIRELVEFYPTDLTPWASAARATTPPAPGSFDSGMTAMTEKPAPPWRRGNPGNTVSIAIMATGRA